MVLMKSKTIILDFGSGNTCQNNERIIKRMYDELKAIDSSKYEIIVKWQLFKVCGANIPLTEESFNYAYEYGNQLGYKVTSSIFDRPSLEFLLSYDIPFVKIANRRELDYLIDFIPEEIPVYISKTNDLTIKFGNKNISGLGCVKVPKELEEFWCISQYPASVQEYLKLDIKIGDNISDNTNNFALFNRFKPKIIKWHYKLKTSTGLDAGEFARTPDKLKEVL